MMNPRVQILAASEASFCTSDLQGQSEEEGGRQLSPPELQVSPLSPGMQTMPRREWTNGQGEVTTTNTAPALQGVQAVSPARLIREAQQQQQQQQQQQHQQHQQQQQRRQQEEDLLQMPMKSLYPVYLPVTSVPTKILRDAITKLLSTVAATPDILPKAIARKRQLLPFAEALRRLHAPRSAAELPEARRRLAFDLLLWMHLASELRLLELGKAFSSSGLRKDGAATLSLFLRCLPFSPTAAQASALEDIRRDLALPRPMRRLVQGDVGSGKTLVAAGALALAAAAGRQAALLAPTTALARQHQRVIGELLSPLGFEVALLTRDAASKEDTIKAINEGTQLLVVGTHALLQRYVRFPRLGLLVIDEQHKFGVQQRSKLLMDCMQGPTETKSPQQQQQKQQQQQHQQQQQQQNQQQLGQQQQQQQGPCDLLLLTATPIPRTQLMSHCGLLHVSRLQPRTEGSSACRLGAPVGWPPGRGCRYDSASEAVHAEGRREEDSVQASKPQSRVKTHVVDRANSHALHGVYKELERCVAAGRQAYWICPFVQESGFPAPAKLGSKGQRCFRGARGNKGAAKEGGCAAAVEAHRELQQQLPNIKFGLLHGRMAAKQQQEVLRLFATGALSVLVSTTVVEVGLDVPNASLIVIDSADRFGISQLHQLRGRVMRNPGQEATCCLLFNSSGRSLDERALTRLAAAATTTDGFSIAARDASLRGSGTMFGVYQHGRSDIALFSGLSVEDRLQLQCEAAADARELLRLYTSAGASEEEKKDTIPFQFKTEGDDEARELQREAEELIQQVQKLMPHTKTDWVLSA